MKLHTLDVRSIQALYAWAKMAAEETRAQVGPDSHEPDTLVPSWLPELEAAIEDVEDAQ